MEDTSKRLNLKVPSPRPSASNDTPTPTRVLNSFIQKSKEVGLFDNSASTHPTQDLDLDGANPFAETFKRATSDIERTNGDSPILTANNSQPYLMVDGHHTKAGLDAPQAPTTDEVTDLTLRPAVAVVPASPRQTGSSCQSPNIENATDNNLQVGSGDASGSLLRARGSNLPKIRLEITNATPTTITAAPSCVNQTSSSVTGDISQCSGRLAYGTYNDQQLLGSQTSRLSRFSETMMAPNLGGSPSIFPSLQSPLLLSPGTPLLQSRDLYKIINGSSGHNLFGNRSADSLLLDSLSSPSCSTSTGPLGSSLQQQQQQQHQPQPHQQQQQQQQQHNHHDHRNQQVSLAVENSYSDSGGKIVQRYLHSASTAAPDANSNYRSTTHSYQQPLPSKHPLSNDQPQHQYPVLSDADYAQVILQQRTALYNGLMQQYQHTNNHHLRYATPMAGHHDKAAPTPNNLPPSSANADFCVTASMSAFVGQSVEKETLAALTTPGRTSTPASVGQTTATNRKPSGQFAQTGECNKMDPPTVGDHSAAASQPLPLPVINQSVKSAPNSYPFNMPRVGRLGSEDYPDCLMSGGNLLRHPEHAHLDSSVVLLTTNPVPDQRSHDNHYIYSSASKENSNIGNIQVDHQNGYHHARVLEILEHQQQQIEMLQQRQDIKDNSLGSMIDQASASLKQPPRLASDHAVNSSSTPISESVGCSNDSTLFDDSPKIKPTASNEADSATISQGEALIIRARNATIKSVRQSKNKSKSSRSPSTTRIEEDSFSFQEPITSDTGLLRSRPRSVDDTKKLGEVAQPKLKKRPGGRRRRNVTSEELQARKNRSKERNRVAAKRCRQKRKVFMDELRKRTDHLDQLNQRLQKENTDLRRELEMLRGQLG